MRLLKIGIASVDATVGAVRSNVNRCIALAGEMAANEVGLAVFPEQVVGGYAPEDLVQWRAFVDAQWAELERFAQATRELATVYALGIAVGIGGDVFNCAAVVHHGTILGLVPKEKLPTYNVFYEARVFSRGVPHLALAANGVPLGDQIFAFDFGTVAFEVCEDAWSPDGPMRRRVYSGAEVVCNLSASPFRTGIVATRREMLATRASDNQATIAYANLVGANDGLVFDGGGFVHQNGRPMLEAPRFTEGYAAVVVDLDRTSRCRREATTWRSDLEAYRATSQPVHTVRASGRTVDAAHLAYPAPPRGASYFLPSAERATLSPREELLDDLYEALATGIAGYHRKTGAFQGIGLALSGGRDSVLTLLVAWRAIQRLHPELDPATLRARMPELLTAFYMPTRYSSDATLEAARAIATDLGARFVVAPIEEAFERELEATRAMLGGEEPTELTKQNVQARIRGQRMWNWSNTSGALFLQTGNMSEKSLGYTTMGGDLEGALGVIANLPKTVVMAMLDRLAARFGFPGIAATLATVPGPELAPDQSGEAELMPYEVLDACLYLFAQEKLDVHEVQKALAASFPERDPAQLAGFASKFARLFTRSIYKWVQAPLSLHVGSLDLDRDRALQLPVVQRSEWAKEPL